MVNPSVIYRNKYGQSYPETDENELQWALDLGKRRDSKFLNKYHLEGKGCFVDGIYKCNIC